MGVAVEKFILAHADVPYDPAKAHEYYLRTRHLKGRVKVQGKVAPGRPQFSAPVKDSQKSAAEQSKEIEAKVAALKLKLAHLRKILAELVREAKSRSGVKSKTNTPSSSKQHTSVGKVHLTGTEKAKAKQASKRYEQKHKNDPPKQTDQVKSLELSIAQVEEKIKKAQADLKASVQRTRTAIAFKPA